jgi:hypothetical protein
MFQKEKITLHIFIPLNFYSLFSDYYGFFLKKFFYYFIVSSIFIKWTEKN